MSRLAIEFFYQRKDTTDQLLQKKKNSYFAQCSNKSNYNSNYGSLFKETADLLILRVSRDDALLNRLGLWFNYI